MVLPAANLHWIGSTNWNNPANWSYTQGGASCSCVPGTADRVYFDAGGPGNCTLDVNTTVSYFEMNGYAGQFNQGTFRLTVYPGNPLPPATSQDAMVLNGGTFNGGSSSLQVFGNYELGAGTVFKCPSLFTFSGDTFRHAGGTFDHNFGKVRMTIVTNYGNPLYAFMTIYGNTTTPTTFFKLDFNAPSFTVNRFYVNTNLTVLDTCWKSGGNTEFRIWGAPNNIYLKGNLIIAYNGNGTYGDINFVFNGSGDQYLVGPAAVNYSDIESVVIDKPAGTLYLVNYIVVGVNWDFVNGNIDAGTSTVYFNGGGFIRGRFSLYNARLKNRGLFDTRYIYGKVTVNGLLEIEGDNTADIYADTIEAKGDIMVNAAATAATFCGGDAYIVINGTGNQTFRGDTRRNQGWLPNIVIDKPSGTLYLRDTINTERSWTYIRGNVDAFTTYRSYVTFVVNLGSSYYTTSDPYYFIDGEGPGGAYMVFDKIELKVPRKLQGDVHIKNKLILNNNNLILNGNDLYIENASNTFIQRNTVPPSFTPPGFIISETSSPPGSIYWYIDNTVAGTTYTFPFAAINLPPPPPLPAPPLHDSIFFNLTIQTAGIPSGGTGWISVATYPTNPNVPANNRPFPPGVTNINNSVGLDNSHGEMDRYWVYNCGNYSTTPQVSMTFRYQDKNWNSGYNQITEANLRPHQWNPATMRWNSPHPTGTITPASNVSTVSSITTCSAFTLVDTTVSVKLVFHASDTTICVGETVQFFDDNTTQPSSRQWFFPGGVPSSSTAASPIVRYDSPGCYDAILRATYTLTYEDTLTCYVHVSDSFSISLAHTDVSCHGDTNGTINVNVSKPGGYEYVWSDGVRAITRTGLAPGTYHVTVADTAALGCSRTGSVTISEPLPLAITIDNVVDATCTCDGRARASASGGTPPFSYQWDSSGTAQTSTTLCPGLRSVTVTDARGCTVSDTVSIAGADPLIVTIDSIKHVSCNGLCNGTARATATGGAGGYSYSWDCWAQSTQTAYTLCAGPCTVTATDIAGCSASATAVINQPSPLVVTIIDYPISANGANDGRVRGLATGGTLPYFPFTHGPNPCVPPCDIDTAIWAQDSLHNLGPGQICFTVYDKNLCFDSACATLVDPTPPLVLSVLDKTDPTCAGVNNGTAWVAASGGTGAYTYSWSRGTNTANDTVTGLSPGPVTVVVTDAGTGSTVSGTLTINPAAGNPITFDRNVQLPICNGSCNGAAWVNNIAGGVPPYSFNWSTASANDTIRNLCAGFYYVTVTDNVGCTKSDTIAVDEPSRFSIAETITPVTCPGGSNGAITLNVSGSNGGPYSYLWSNGAPSAPGNNGLAEGFYSVIVSDLVGCTATESYTVQVGTRFEIEANIINASCGNNDGTIVVSVLGGAGSPSYSWSGGAAGASPNVRVQLSAGQYTVTVTTGSCTQTLIATVENSGRPDVTGVVTDATDCSSNDGSISLAVTGGSGGYSFAWSHGPFTTSAVTGLMRGSYTVTVTDDTTLCTAVSTFTVKAVREILMNATVVNATCGVKDGSISLNVLTGTPPYTYAWSNGTSLANNTNLGFGTYIVTVSDARGCVGDSVFTVSEGGPGITGAAVTHVSCFGGSNGAISLTVSGNSAFVWSNGQTTQNISGLPPGIYSVTATVNTTVTSAQCSSAQAFTVTEPDAFTLAADRSSISCPGSSDGWIDLTPSGGTPGYAYSWSGTGTFTSSQEDISGLAAGYYNVTATDSKSCTASLSSIEITQPDSMSLILVAMPASCAGLSDGEASVFVLSGTSPFTYSWSRGFPPDNDTVVGLAAGPVRVTVTDANGCTKIGNTDITEPLQLILTLTKNDISCAGANDGRADVTANGGTPGYTYTWSRGTPAGNSVTGLIPGYVMVTVTDANSCVNTDSIEITEPLPLTTTVTATSNVSCFGGSDGAAEVFPSGGRGPYTYSWSAGTPPRTNPSITGLPPGITQVSVSDASSCLKIDSVTISQPATAIATTITKTDVSCFNGNDGTAAVIATGGTPPYAYNWSGGIPGNTDNVSQLMAGNAIVTVTDSSHCQAIDTAVISQPPAISLSTSQINISCFGANDGTASVLASGGTPGNITPYTYLWSAGNLPRNQSSVAGLGPGPVSVDVRDSLNCLQTATLTIIEPPDIAVNIRKLDISCFGLTDGMAWVDTNGIGGTPGFTYAWNSGTPGITPDTTKNLSQGQVSVTVTDSRNCTDSASIMIVEPADITLSIAKTDVSCFGGNNGTADVDPLGGSGGFTYNWSKGIAGTAPDKRIQLTAGVVTVTVTDSRNCFDTISASINQPADSISTVITKTDVSCFGGNDGTAAVTATGGTPGYTYSWSSGTPPLSNPAVTGLRAGTVSVTVTDANLCTHTRSITLMQPAELILTMAVDSNASCNGGADGGLTVSLTGGTPSYSYNWSNAQQLLNTNQTSHTISGLTVGIYTVSVTDSKNCIKQITRQIVERAGPQETVAPVIVQPTCDRANGAISVNVTTSDPPLTYSWSHNLSLNSNVADNLPEGNYTVTITDGAACDTVMSFPLSEIPGPAVVANVTKHSYCDDFDGHAEAVVTSGTPPFRYLWVDAAGNTVSTATNVTGLVPGNYTLSVTDFYDCPAQDAFTINNIAKPIADISPVSPVVIYAGQIVEITGSSNISTSAFAWNPTSGLSCSNCDALAATPHRTTTYTLTVTDTTTDCQDVAYITIIVKDERNIFVPNVITPNGDGVNDLWNIADLLEVFPDNEVVIVNRWGDEVFRTKNYGITNDKKWDGTYKGEKLPDGTYYYVIKLNNIDKVVTGPVTIISE